MKRRNLLSLFLDGFQADRYIATHLYGELVRRETIDDTHIIDESGVINDMMQESIMRMGDNVFDESLLRVRKRS